MEFSMFLHGSLTLIAIILLSNLLRKSSKSFSSKGGKSAPVVRGSWPIIGHLHLMMGKELPHHALAKLADKYGPAFTLNVGAYQELVISSWDLAKECFTTKDKYFLNRPSNTAMKILTYGEASLAVAPYGPLLVEMRKVSKSNFLSHQRVMMQNGSRASEIDASVKQLYELANGKSGVPVEMKTWFQEVLLNVVTRSVSGKKSFGTKARLGDAEAVKYKRATDEASHFIGSLAIADMVPSLWWLDNMLGTVSAMKKVAIELDSILGDWVEEHKGKRLSGDEEGDFIGLTWEMMDQIQLHGLSPETFIKSMCVANVLGGSDTTSVALMWVLSLMLNNRKVLKKAQEELDFHVGKDRKVDDSDLNNLVYLQAILKETMRTYQVNPLIEREAIEDCEVGGFHIKKGNRILVNLWKLQRDPEVWSDPSEFRPERFLKDKSKVDLKGQNAELMPFGIGRRMCPGTLFSIHSASLVLARLIQGFEMETPLDAKVDMTETSSVTNYKGGPLEVLFTPRLKPKLYDF